MIKQADVIDDEYNPLVYVKGVASWPSQPKYDLLLPHQAELLQNCNVNLESFWNNWPHIYRQHYNKDLPSITLQKGRDFDQIVYGLSIGSLSHTCSDLLKYSHNLKDAFHNIKTVATQAFQVWTDPNLSDLGWKESASPLLVGIGEPIGSTYASMNQLLPKEHWVTHRPQHVGYFCAPLKGNPHHFPGKQHKDFPAVMTNIVKKNAIASLKNMRKIWPKAFNHHGNFNWTVLSGNDTIAGQHRFDTQYWRANIDPSELYVQTCVNTSKYRIDTHAGFNNIYFTGDWIKTKLNVGCVEAAVLAGLQTADAILQKN